MKMVKHDDGLFVWIGAHYAVESDDVGVLERVISNFYIFFRTILLPSESREVITLGLQGRESPLVDRLRCWV